MSDNLRELYPAALKRIPQRDVNSRNIRWLVQVDVDRTVLEERWGAPEIAEDDFAEWLCFAFSPMEGEAFILLRQVHHPPVAGFVLSVTRGLFSLEAAERVLQALDIPGVQITHMNAEATS